MKRTHYIKATGSVCYDKTGITFPNTLKIDLVGLVEYFAGQIVDWDFQYGWSNQPLVIVFNADDLVFSEIKEFNIFLSELRLIAVPIWEYGATTREF